MAFFKRTPKKPPQLRIADLAADTSSPFPFIEPDELLNSVEIQPKVHQLSDSLQHCNYTDFQHKIWPLLLTLASYTGLTPGSEISHHRHPGGLLEHLLDVAIRSVRALNDGPKLLPDELIEHQDRTPYLWPAQVATVLLAITHDLAKVKTDVTIKLYDASSNNRTPLATYDCDRDGTCNTSLYEWYLSNGRPTKSNQRYLWKYEQRPQHEHEKYWQSIIDVFRKQHVTLLRPLEEVAPYFLDLASPFCIKFIRPLIKEADRASAIANRPTGDELLACVAQSLLYCFAELAERGRLRSLPMLDNRYLFVSEAELQRWIYELPNEEVFWPLLLPSGGGQRKNDKSYVFKLLDGAGVTHKLDADDDRAKHRAKDDLYGFSRGYGAFLDEYTSRLYNSYLAPHIDVSATIDRQNEQDDESPSSEDTSEQSSVEVASNTSPEQSALEPPPIEQSLDLSEVDDSTTGIQRKQARPHYLASSDVLDMVEALKEIVLADHNGAHKVVDSNIYLDSTVLAWLGARKGIDIDKVATECPNGFEDQFKIIISEEGLYDGILVYAALAKQILEANKLPVSSPIEMALGDPDESALKPVPIAKELPSTSSPPISSRAKGRSTKPTGRQISDDEIKDWVRSNAEGKSQPAAKIKADFTFRIPVVDADELIGHPAFRGEFARRLEKLDYFVRREKKNYVLNHDHPEIREWLRTPRR